MKGFKVGLKYCGNCNPRIDAPLLVKNVQAILPEIEIIPVENTDRDVLLIISGCEVGCASRFHIIGPSLVVAGVTINRVQFDISDLASCVAMKLIEIYNGSDLNTK